MKLHPLLGSALLCLAIAGCGSKSGDEEAARSGFDMKTSASVASGDSAAAVSVAGYRDNYAITRSQDSGLVVVTSKISGKVETYQNPTLLKFVDKWVAFDINGPAGQVYRMYQAAFNRKPDLPGLGFWIKANENGRSIVGIASDFMASDEFRTLYGTNPAASAFINSMYQNVLHRAGDSDGFNWWVTQVTAGADRAGVLQGFADSAENKANLLADMKNGFDFVPFQPGGAKIPQPASYSNAKSVGLGPQAIPVEAGGMPQDGFAYFHAYAFADFFQDGSYSMVTASTEYLNDPAATEYTAQPGHVRFWKKDGQGKWIDRTSDLLADNAGCILARKAVIADFNGDGKPDVFLACHGYDAVPFPGERQRVLLSQSNGSYKNVLLDVNCFCHGAAAADFDGNGYADIVVTDFLGGKGAYFLKNNKDGTFTVDATRLPETIKYKGAIFSAEIVDLNGDGKLDVWLAGNEKDWPTTIFYNDGSNSFANAKQVIMPPDASFPSPVDIVVAGNAAYVLRTDSNVSGAAIQKVDLGKMQGTPIYRNTDYYPGQPLKWLDWITDYGDSIVSLNSAFGVAVKK